MSDPAPASSAPARRPSRGELGLLGLLVGLVALTALTVWSPRLRFAVLAPEVDLLINGVATLIAGAAAWLAWLRHRHMADLSAVYQAAAFVIFTVTAATQTLADLGVGEDELGLSLDDPRQAPLYAWSLLRVLAGALLLRAAWLRLRPRAASYRRAGLTIAASLAGGTAMVAVLYAVEPVLPPLLAAEAVERLAAPGTVLGPLPGVTLLELALQSVAVIILGAASVAYAMAARRGTGSADRYLSAGLLLAAFAQVHFGLFPGIYSGLLTSSDLIRVCFYGFIVFGIQADAGAALRQLRTANLRLHELRELELANASLAERARLARELHDGLAQHLWLAKLATERLAGERADTEIEQVRAELAGLLDAGLEEARQTVMALRDSTASNTPFAEVIARHVRRFEEQTGLSTRLEVRATSPEPVPPRAAAELLRIAQEALNNVRKHADATMVTVELAHGIEAVRLSVRDNGVGFDSAADHPGYGLQSMAERAAALGGRLDVDTSPLNGTSVRAEIPLRAGRALREGST